MDRSRFLILASLVPFAAGVAPRRAIAAPGGRVRFVRRHAFAGMPGRCVNHRARRWSGFSASDFHVQASASMLRRRGDWNGVREC